jgi:hypothetical protein
MVFKNKKILSPGIKKMRTKLALLLIGLILAFSAPAQAQARESRPPIIDMHLHALDFELWPLAQPEQDVDDAFGPVFDRQKMGILAARSTEELQQQTLIAMDRYNIVFGVVSGSLAESYRKNWQSNLLASPFVEEFDKPIDWLRAAFNSGRYQALAEFDPQYYGLAPNAPELDPYFALAEELDIPVGIHIGLGPPGVAYGVAPDYRMALSDALLLEDVLVEHPDLRLYVMHAGWPLLDKMVGLLYAFPQVYIDISVINWYVPTEEFYSYFQRLVEAGFSKRIMFGSDQMVWPDAIGRAIETVESAPFLSDEQRRDIMCRNAATFLRLEETVCN